MKKKHQLQRILIGAIFLILQCAIFYLGYFVLNEYSMFALGGEKIIALVMILYILNCDEDSGFKLSWIFLISIFTIFGSALYLYTRRDYFSAKISKSLRNTHDSTNYINNEDDHELKKMIAEKNPDAGAFTFVHSSTGYLPYTNTVSKYFPLGDEAFPFIKSELMKARKYIFIEFFIINEGGRMWREIYDILCAKAKEGIEVRVMYDAMGSLSTTPVDFADKMEKSGIKCCEFSPVRPFLSTVQNNRDHRKIIIIDGETAFTGGINISDEYINERELFGHWKDNSIAIKGEAVKSFNLMFLRMWNALHEEKDNFEDYITVGKSQTNIPSDGYFAPFDDVPSRNERVGKWLYINMLNTATDYVYIMTPYLVLDDEMRGAMKFAAKRGVDVRIIMPHIPDKWYAFALARTYYPELLESGVKIFEYTPGFIHSKTTVSDDRSAVIGTVNYDYRSLYLHYECGMYISGSSAVAAMKNDMVETMEKSQNFTYKDYKSTPIYMRAAGRILRVFAPLM